MSSQLSINRYSDDRIVENSTIISRDGSLLYSINSPNDTNSNIQVVNSHVEYSYDINSEVNLDAYIGYYGNERANSNFITNRFLFGENDFGISDRNLFQTNSYSIFTSKISVSKKLVNRQVFRGGIKYEDAAIATNMTEEISMEEDLFESSFDYTERTLSAYAEYSKSFERLDLNAGLRYENFESSGSSQNLSIDQDISKVFLSGNMTYHINKYLNTNMSFSQRVERPSFSALNLNRNVIDAFTSSTGNPSLEPGFTNKYELNLSYLSQPFVVIGHLSSNNKISTVFIQENESGIGIRRQANFDTYKHWNFNLFFPIRFFNGNISGYGGVITNYDRYKTILDGDVIDVGQWSHVPVIHLEGRIIDRISMSADFWNVTGGVEGVTTFGNLNQLTFSVDYRSKNKNFSVGIKLENVIVDYFNGQVEVGGLNYFIDNRWNPLVISASARYTIGSLKNRESDKPGDNSSGYDNRRGGGSELLIDVQPIRN